MSKGKKTDKVAYSKFFKSNIKCVGFRTNTNWDFVLCDEHGNPTNGGKVMRAQSYYSMFDWKDV